MAKQSSIKTIFWDIGGVLLSNGWDRNQRARVLTPLGVDLADYEPRHAVANYYWERGHIDARTFFEQTVFAPEPRDFSFADLWPRVCAESQVLHPGSFDILQSLQAARASGEFKLATLNNESTELNEYRLDAFHLRSSFDFFICSGFVHEMKPLADIYRAAILISGQPAATAVFIDDKQENVDAARAHGMQAICFESPAQLRSSLAELGVALDTQKSC
ncbi:MAG TPA: HAD-IA family hydrolase [Granulicella sp.]|jgi:FMN phosphatase YigB (HAD superfamily)|nr:HAD-IA family hydrolase [Granulicella sp.]